MNLLAPVSTIMTSKVFTVSPNDSLAGMISKSDINLFLKWWNNDKYQDLFNGVRLNHYTADDIMTRGLAKIEPTDRINVVVKVFEENLFHAIPVVNGANELEGIVTTYDMIKLMAAEDAERVAALKN